MELYPVVRSLAALTQAWPDADLEREWNWGPYEEGVRFAHFRTYEELRWLAVQLAAQRQASAAPLTQAQRVLGQFHLAYRDLQAVLLGVDDPISRQAPDGEWPVRTALCHLIESERNFLAIHFSALQSLRRGEPQPFEMTEAAWDAFWEGDIFRRLEADGSLDDLLGYFDALHARVLAAFQDTTGAELEEKTLFWDGMMPLSFRLGRFDSHLRQHTIQVEKILAAVGAGPTEARRLHRLIYNALAEGEAAWIGAAGPLPAEAAALAQVIQDRAREIAGG